VPARHTRALALTAVAALLALGACTASGPSPDLSTGTQAATPTPSASAAPVQRAALTLPAGPATVIGGSDAASRALATSAALFASSPVAVLAPVADVAAQVRAAAVAVALGAPLLVSAQPASTTHEGRDAGAEDAGSEDGGNDAAGGGTGAAGTSASASPSASASSASAGGAAASAEPDPVAAELGRLGVDAVLTVGDVGVDVSRVTGLERTRVVPVPADDTAVAALVGRELSPAPWPAAGQETGTVAALDRAAPSLPTSTNTPGAATPVPGTTPAASAGAASTSPSDSPSATRGPSATPSPSPSPSPLPPTELAAPLAGGVVLTSGDPADLAALATARAAGLPVVGSPGDPRASSPTIQALAAAKPTSVIGLGPVYGDAATLAWTSATAATGVELPGGGQLVLAGRRYVAMYGTPTYAALGVLGEQDLPSSVARVQGMAAVYQTMTSDRVVPAFELIVTVASAGAGPDGNYSNELPVETFTPWVEAAEAAGLYVVLDLQPGRTDFLTQAKAYEPLLLHPNVGLALDPEWRLAPDQVHLRQIGSVGIDEVNAVATYLADLTRTHALPQKLFVLHQFKGSMVAGRERLDMSHPELAPMIHVDGQGSQPAKAGTWGALHDGAPAGVAWGWKNFIDEDVPMLTPAQTYAITPQPQLVTYQ
jgi:hypothetical protein